jgi:dihydroxy-acid dehydratase
MDAKTNIKARLPSRHATEGPARASSHRFERGIRFDVASVFKKTLYIADLKPAGRYVAKDIVEVSGIPLPLKTQHDHGFLHGDCAIVTGRTIAEKFKSVKWTPNQDVASPANDPITVIGDIVGRNGIPAPHGAIVYGAVTHPGGKAEKVSHAGA